MSEPAILANLLPKIHACKICQAQLPLGPRPIVQLNPNARLLLIGQAPGKLAHEHRKPFSDPSGDRLRAWLGLSPAEFYHENLVAIMPMAFCYPGKLNSGSGDKAPPKICAQTWHERIRATLPQIELTLLIGRYAAEQYQTQFNDVTSAVKAQSIEDSDSLVLPHPSPRNNIWLKKNDWFERKTLPKIRQRLQEVLRT